MEGIISLASRLDLLECLWLTSISAMSFAKDRGIPNGLENNFDVRFLSEGSEIEIDMIKSTLKKYT